MRRARRVLEGGGAARIVAASAVAAVASASTQCESTFSETDLVLLGRGRCVDGADLEPRAFACDSPDYTCALINNSTSACGLACLVDDGCTGFEVRQQFTSDSDGGTSSCCRVFFQSPPSAGAGIGSWVVAADGGGGTQPPTGSQLVVLSASASHDRNDACCFKRAAPRPCPRDNPPVKPPKMSAGAQAIYDRMNVLAAAASDAALPALAELVGFCAAKGLGPDGQPGSLFSAEHCPGMADLTGNGTLAPYPSPAQIIRRFVEETWASEFGHAYGVLFSVRVRARTLF
jgi:hypothetical protein